jgi:endonuclease G
VSVVNPAGRKTVYATLRVAAIAAALYFVILAAFGDSWSGLVPARAASVNVVISQVYGGGGNTGATFRNDYIELFNRSTTAVSVTGWSVQYASSAGTTWQVTNLTGTIAPGAYYLVQEGAGAGGTTNLPTPDATGGIAMSATAAKVALVNTTTALTGTGCPFDASVVDFVGYGSASCFEGTAAAPALTNTTAELRNGSGCMETDSNSVDFASGSPNPRNSSATALVCDGNPTPSPSASGSPTASPSPSASASPTPTPSPTGSPSSDSHLTMGNPSGATTDVNQPLNYLMEKPQYALSYNRDRGIPNWVSWHLDNSWLGSAPRQNDFRNDPSLPAGWYQVLATDYTGSGFDRGHHCPSADRTDTIPDNSATFFMTNMMPQAPDNNQGPWAVLEGYCRTLVAAGNELYIITGGVGTGGTGSSGGVTMTVASGHVAVPAQTWKVIIVIPAGDNDVSRVNKRTRTIAVILPNTQGIRGVDWHTFRVSVDAVESLTGYDFFSNVPIMTQRIIERRVDNQP